MAVGGAIVGAVLLLFLPPMELAAAPYAIATSFIHVAYFALVARAYAQSELSVAYPIMRGLAPLIVTGLAVFVETPPPAVIVGIVVVTAGIVSLGLERLRAGNFGLAPAIANAFVIALYTLIDGLGARASGSPATYVAWILLGAGIATLVWQVFREGPATVLPALRARLPIGIVGGAMGYAAYGIALWAMTFTAIGAVAAVRESSVLFAAALGAIALHERFGWARWLSAILVAAGLVLVKFGGPS